MNAMPRFIRQQRGLTIVELLVAMSISLVVVVAAAYVYLATRESQQTIDRTASSRETGVFVMQMLGREILNAGFYPATATTITQDATQQGMYDTYPPLPADPRVATDWQNPANLWPPAAFQAGIFGCDSAQFDVQTSTCASSTSGLADTLVINYFTSDTPSMGTSAGRRFDCTGTDVGLDSSNAERMKNSTASPQQTTQQTAQQTAQKTPQEGIPPQLPLFVSNRFTLNNLKISVDQKDIKTKSLVCSGNGKSPHGTADATAYQPIMPGLEDLKFSYALQDEDIASPSPFFTATDVTKMASQTFHGLALSPWQRVAAVRVCLLTRTLGGNTRIADKTGTQRTYLDCSNTRKTQPPGDTITRYVEVFGLRNRMKKYY